MTLNFSLPLIQCHYASQEYELGLESSGSSNFGFLNMDYKKGLVCYISTCTYLKVALGLYKGVYLIFIFIKLYLFGCFINEKSN